MDVTLVVVGGKTHAAEVKLSLPTVIGRGPDCKVRLPQPLVSRRHCELFEAQGRLIVRDLDSMNGTYVGSQRVEEAELPHEGLLTIGAVTFRAIYQPGEPAASDGGTQHDFGADTKTDAVASQSVEIAGPMDPVEIEGFEEFRDNQNDVTLPAPPPAGSDEETTDGAEVALPPAIGEARRDATPTE